MRTASSALCECSLYFYDTAGRRTAAFGGGGGAVLYTVALFGQLVHIFGVPLTRQAREPA